MLKTGLTSMAMEDIDILENYCLAHGIKSYKWKYEKWSFGIKDDESEKYLKINSLKDEFLNIFAPILTLNLKKKYTVDFITTAIYEILEAMGVKESLLEISKKNIESEHENRQCWNIVVDIFDALNEIMGKREVTLLEYYTLFEGGISVSNMGIIPPTVDSVTIGTLERSRLPKTKALIVIGVNEGVIPSGGAAQGILSDEERSVIESTGVRLAPSTLRRAFEEHFIIYSSITKSEQYLYLTYSMGDLAGKSLLPSSIIGKIREIFPTLKVKYSKDIKEEIFYSPAITLHHMGEGMAEGQKTQWLQVYSYLKSKSKWENKATIIAKGMEEPSDNNTLAQKTVDKLYGDVIFSSVSRLERFSACPYSYFLLYTLKAKERPVFALGVPDLGTLFHNVLEEFGKTLQQDNTNWADVSVEEISAMVSDIVDTQAPRLGSEILLSANSLVYLTKRLKRICTKAMVTLAKHLRLGKFEPYAYELGFGMGQKLPPIAVDLENGKRMLLNGKIDRVDILEKDGSTYVKIIDYKSGSSEFNLQDMYYGLQLQLL
ncbi:MAG: PD-(D/E)XK nuclease family protein, partial [Anaerotignaceae bacterium]